MAETAAGTQSQDLEHVALRHKGTPKTVEKRLLSEEWGLRFYGYLDGSYTQNFNNPSSRINQLRIFDVNSNELRPNLAQFVLEKEAEASGDWKDRAGFKVKFNAGRDSDFIGGVNLSTWADFQEFYVQYIAPIGKGLNVQLGQINTLIGYEVVESPHNPNYSRSWLFGLGQPFTTRGGRASYEFTKQVSLSVGVISFINSARGNSRHDPLVESALTITPSERIKVTLYGLAGPRPGATGTAGGNILLAGGFASLHATEQTSLVIESYYANQANSSMISTSGNARWNGVAAYVIHDFTAQWGLRVRGELFEDAGGFVACEGTTDYQPRANVCFGATSCGIGSSRCTDLVGSYFNAAIQAVQISHYPTRISLRQVESQRLSSRRPCHQLSAHAFFRSDLSFLSRSISVKIVFRSRGLCRRNRSQQLKAACRQQHQPRDEYEG